MKKKVILGSSKGHVGGHIGLAYVLRVKKDPWKKNVFNNNDFHDKECDERVDSYEMNPIIFGIELRKHTFMEYKLVAELSYIII